MHLQHPMSFIIKVPNMLVGSALVALSTQKILVNKQLSRLIHGLMLQNAILRIN